jgi:hypothetical protein
VTTGVVVGNEYVIASVSEFNATTGTVIPKFNVIRAVLMIICKCGQYRALI